MSSAHPHIRVQLRPCWGKQYTGLVSAQWGCSVHESYSQQLAGDVQVPKLN